jgi:hypothetical protein
MVARSVRASYVMPKPPADQIDSCRRRPDLRPGRCRCCSCCQRKRGRRWPWQFRRRSIRPKGSSRPSHTTWKCSRDELAPMSCISSRHDSRCAGPSPPNAEPTAAPLFPAPSKRPCRHRCGWRRHSSEHRTSSANTSKRKRRRHQHQTGATELNPIGGRRSIDGSQPLIDPSQCADAYRQPAIFDTAAFVGGGVVRAGSTGDLIFR